MERIATQRAQRRALQNGPPLAPPSPARDPSQDDNMQDGDGTGHIDMATLSDDNQIIQPVRRRCQHIMLHDSDVEVDKENFRLGKDTDAALGREDEHNLEREEREEEEELVRRHSTEEQE